MRLALRLHPESKSTAVSRIEVELVRPVPTELLLRYEITGDMTRVRLPPPATPARHDDLWRTTCFEAFLRSPLWKPYYELNFAPSTHWAAYRFSDYRLEMTPAEEIRPIEIASLARLKGFELGVSLDMVHSELPPDVPWRLSLAAIIEEADGNKSFWAWAHPKGMPDFHHADAFACELPPP
jgi:hypothetical protein